MLLAIDSGNTNTVFSVFNDDGKVLGEWRASSTREHTADEHGVWLMQLLNLDNIDRKEIKSAIIATVVPSTLFSLKTLCRTYFNADPLVVGEPGVKLGIKVLLPQPQEVGADRLVNAISAHQSYGGPLIIVDFGTATTFDVVDADGNYTGGIITPGVNLSQEALHLAAAKLPRVAICRPEKVIGTGTVSAMQSGIYWGYLSMIEGVVKRIAEEFGSPMKVIATGGLAPLFAEATDSIECADAELTLRGLFAIHKLNKSE
ncbi:MAG: type III pantothenate kinase [Rhodospirillales bacterium]|nr:type III pantothenate kinase [Rhodospirillales bacterium]